MDAKVKEIKEFILCSAIWYKDIPLVKKFEANVLPVNCDRGLVFCGHRHPHCMYTMISVTGIRSVTTEIGEYKQGFLTNKNRFVSREEAGVIAFNAGQTNKLIKTLHSEDLY